MQIGENRKEKKQIIIAVRVGKSFLVVRENYKNLPIMHARKAERKNLLELKLQVLSSNKLIGFLWIGSLSHFHTFSSPKELSKPHETMTSSG